MRKATKSPDEMTFLEHLEDLRKRLFYSFIAIIGATVVAWFFHEKLYEILSHPVTQYLPEGEKLAFTTLTAPFMVYIKVSFLTSIFISSPFIFLQLWYFVAPGLYRKEKKYVVPFVLFTSFFFTLGALFGYFIAFPFACGFFLRMSLLFFVWVGVFEINSLRNWSEIPIVHPMLLDAYACTFGFPFMQHILRAMTGYYSFHIDVLNLRCA